MPKDYTSLQIISLGWKGLVDWQGGFVTKVTGWMRGLEGWAVLRNVASGSVGGWGSVLFIDAFKSRSLI
jgi:hypothetical protein